MKTAFPICFSLTFTALSHYTKCKPVPQGDVCLLCRAYGCPSAQQSQGGCSWASLPAPPLGPSDPTSFNEPLNINYKRCLRKRKGKLVVRVRWVCLCSSSFKENFQICRLLVFCSARETFSSCDTGTWASCLWVVCKSGPVKENIFFFPPSEKCIYVVLV